MDWFDELQRVSTSPETAARIRRARGELDVTALASRVAWVTVPVARQERSHGRAHPLPTMRGTRPHHRAVLAGSTAGPVEHLKTGCVNNHWLTPLAETLATAQPKPTPAAIQLASA
jgi:hypothetical protein